MYDLSAVKLSQLSSTSGSPRVIVIRTEWVSGAGLSLTLVDTNKCARMYRGRAAPLPQ